MSSSISQDDLWARWCQLDQAEKRVSYDPDLFRSSQVYSSSPQVQPTLEFQPRRVPIIHSDPYSIATFPSSGYTQHPTHSSPTHDILSDVKAVPAQTLKPETLKLRDDPSFGQEDEFGFSKNTEWLESVDLDDAAITSRIEHTRPDSKTYDDGERPVTQADLAQRRQAELALLKRRQEDTGQRPDQPPTIDGIAPIPIDTLALEQQAIFESKFRYFNAVQSKVLPIALDSDDNLVVSAPTGSGKTTIFDLALLRMIDTSAPGSNSYAIYLAPTKALCGERTRDWRERLGGLGIKCAEVTGDTTSIWAVEIAVKESRLIITTPEKWEAVTRTSRGLGNRGPPALVMIDEVHFLRDNRGATLEVLVSRMKSQDPQTRFVALSATVPNIKDIAQWLTPVICDEAEQKPVETRVLEFGDEYRPVKLLRYVHGYSGGANDFALMKKYESDLWVKLVKYSDSKPVLVFCPTRRACQSVADSIATSYVSEEAKGDRRLPWRSQSVTSNQRDNQKRIPIIDQKLRAMVAHGIAFHHAGLDTADRREVEDRFLDGRINMIACTSTLAVGVNLPAHTVIIMGTSAWQGPVAGFKEYSDIDIQQMIGRAGRPQFDRTGTCVIMCDKSNEQKYRDLVNSRTVVESALHDHLTDHINTEIGLKTITCLESAKKWIKNSFLFIRIQQNPRHYSKLGRKTHHSWEATLDHYVEEAISNLENQSLVKWFDSSQDDETDSECSNEAVVLKPARVLQHTEYGECMSTHVISYDTMCHIMTMQSTTTVRGLLEILAGAAEFQDLRVRPGEAKTLNLLRKHPEIRYRLDEPVQSYADKVFLNLQAAFGNVTIDEDKKNSEVTSIIGTQIAIFKDASRIAKATARVAWLRGWGRTARNSIELLRTVHGKAWEDSEVVFRQIPSIGPKSIGKLGANNIKSFDDLERTPAREIETLLGRTKAPISTPGGSINAGFGEAVHQCIKLFPRYDINLEQIAIDKQPGQYPVVEILVELKARTNWKGISESFEEQSPTKGDSSGKKKRRPNYNLTMLVTRNDGTLLEFRRINAYALTSELSSFVLRCELADPQHKIEVYAGVDELSGCATQSVFDPQLQDLMFDDVVEDSLGDESDRSSISNDHIEKAADPKHRAVSVTPPSRPVVGTERANSDRQQEHSRLPVQGEMLPSPLKRGHSIKDDYRDAIANIAKPRASSQRGSLIKPEPEPEPAIQAELKHKSRPTQSALARSQRRRASAPKDVRRYLDTEAIESEDEETEEYDTDDANFIDDMHARSTEREPLKRVHRPAHQVKIGQNDPRPPDQADASDKQATAADAGMALPSRLSSSDDFDGIEDVEVVLDNDGSPAADGQPLFLPDSGSQVSEPGLTEEFDAHYGLPDDSQEETTDMAADGMPDARTASQTSSSISETSRAGPDIERDDEYDDHGHGHGRHHDSWSESDMSIQSPVENQWTGQASNLDQPAEPRIVPTPGAFHGYTDYSEDASSYLSAGSVREGKGQPQIADLRRPAPSEHRPGREQQHVGSSPLDRPMMVQEDNEYWSYENEPAVIAHGGYLSAESASSDAGSHSDSGWGERYAEQEEPKWPSDLHVRSRPYDQDFRIEDMSVGDHDGRDYRQLPDSRAPSPYGDASNRESYESESDYDQPVPHDTRRRSNQEPPFQPALQFNRTSRAAHAAYERDPRYCADVHRTYTSEDEQEVHLDGVQENDQNHLSVQEDEFRADMGGESMITAEHPEDPDVYWHNSSEYGW